MVEALQIIDQESLERWLSDRPVDWARQIALRASLRVFPLVTSGWNKGSDVDKERIQGLALAVWRCLLISSVGIKNSSGNLRQAAAAAADAADAAAVAAALATGAAVDAARSAAAATARAASVFVSADVPNIAARAASSAASAGYFVRSNSVPGEIWESVHADAQFLEANGKALEEQRLWLDDVRGSEKYQANFPPWARKPFDAFAGSQLARTTSWGLIVDWYRALLPNALNNAPQSLFDEMVEVQIATQSDEFWSRKDPQAVIDDIARIAERKDPPAKPSNRIEASDYDQSRFSVIRTEKDEYWEGGKIFSYDRSRFLERGYTNTFFRDEFSNLNPITIEKLKRLPTLFTYESGTAGSSKVGKLVDIRPTESTLELKVEFDPRFTDIQSDDLANLWKKIDVFKGRIELSRTQWAIKEGNLFDLLSQLHQTANSEESVTSKEGAGLTNNIPTGRAETAYVGDNVDGSVDYLQRSEIAFALAGQLNDVWDSMNPPPSPVIPFDSAYWTGLFKRSPKQTLEPGFVVHVDAPWGGGKTTFAQYLTQILNPYRLPQLPKWLKDLPLGDAEKWKQSHRRPWHVVQFNAWQHEHVSPPWWVFYETIRKAATDAAVNETNQRWDDPPPGKSQDETNRPAEPLRV
ncbi:P-loop NTPase fold protein [Hoeflea sp.]|uniref:P-loop NTPase fold protein n=1 Tax=Hoeflea sp. TaxID=1940281 RepID=UPI003A8D45EA